MEDLVHRRVRITTKSYQQRVGKNVYHCETGFGATLGGLTVVSYRGRAWVGWVGMGFNILCNKMTQMQDLRRHWFSDLQEMQRLRLSPNCFTRKVHLNTSSCVHPMPITNITALVSKRRNVSCRPNNVRYFQLFTTRHFRYKLSSLMALEARNFEELVVGF
jgi:hypothetical protein